jgi:hypothetical protein
MMSIDQNNSHQEISPSLELEAMIVMNIHKNSSSQEIQLNLEL